MSYLEEGLHYLELGVVTVHPVHSVTLCDPFRGLGVIATNGCVVFTVLDPIRAEAKPGKVDRTV